MGGGDGTKEIIKTHGGEGGISGKNGRGGRGKKPWLKGNRPEDVKICMWERAKIWKSGDE